jgi:hypothetical protein
MELQADDWLAEVLLHDGQILAAALGGPGLDRPLAGSAALAALLDQTEVAWRCRLVPLDEPLAAALAGLGGEPRPLRLGRAEELRELLRELAGGGESGVLELSAGERWARTAICAAQVLGAFSDDSPSLTPSLAPLGTLLAGPLPLVRWYPAATAAPLALPPAPAVEGAVPAEVERQVIWIVSRFEGAWSRAREGRASPAELAESLIEMLRPLLTLASELEKARGNPAALEAALAGLAEASPPEDELLALNERLDGVGPQQACPILVELVAGALRRIVLACPDPNLAECCRQAARALETELRAAFPAPAGRKEGEA